MPYRTRRWWLSTFLAVCMMGCGSRADLGTALDLHDQQPSATAAGAWPSNSGGRTSTSGAVTTSTKVSNNLGGSGAMILGGNKPQGTLGSANVGGGTGGSKAPWALAGAASGRIVAIGDLHSDIQATRRAFELAGATNPDGEWIGGALTVVQLGDLIGRGDDERQVLDFIFDLRGKAEAAGGKLHNLIGNHEIMAARVDNQAVGTNPFPGFEDLPDLALDDPRLQQLPENQRARGAALMAGGTIAKRLAEFETVLQIGQTLFVHGGVAPKWAQYGIEQINHEVSDWLSNNISVPTSTLGYDDGDRVMWTRQFSSGVDASDCALLEQTLSMLGAKRMIVAHTVQPTIRSLCNEQLWIIDVGMARYYGGPVEVLQIEDDAYLTVLRY